MATDFDPASAPASVFYPSSAAASTRLKKATFFTRLGIRATPEIVKRLLETTTGISNTFCLGHYNDILVFDMKKDLHEAHVKSVLQMLKDNNLKADLGRCAFDKPGWAEAGFHIEPVSQQHGKQAFMVLLREHVAPEARQSEYLYHISLGVIT